MRQKKKPPEVTLMFEKVNPSHPDKIADRIAGALVDLAYAKNPNAKVAVEVLIGHYETLIINETDTELFDNEVKKVVERISGESRPVTYREYNQDKHLAENQNHGNPRCGDNGIFRGFPVTVEERLISNLSQNLYKKYPTDGKIVLTEDALTVCQSNADTAELAKDKLLERYKTLAMAPELKVNPLGDWTGGLWVDTGATNRKLGSDMGYAITGGGLHGKDLSKADITLNICCHLIAEYRGELIEAGCAIGDEVINFWNEEEQVEQLYYADCVQMAREYIQKIGGFEKFAEWGIIR